jgi:hypothetical protein
VPFLGIKKRASGARSVRDDWAAWLPTEKGRVFDGITGRWDTTYAMVGVSLNEAITLRGQAKLVRARLFVGNSAVLLERLAAELVSVLRIVEEHGRHFGTLTLVEPLNPDNFQGETAKRLATRNSLFHHFLLGERSRFFQKLRALSETVEELTAEFYKAAEDIAEGTTIQPMPCWESLVSLHYDLNTCVQESRIVLKSFLHAIPEKELDRIRTKIGPRPPVTAARARARYSRTAS